jgi:hypothetical protein
MIRDRLIGHLVDITENAPIDALILGGGLGLRVRRAYLRHTGVVTLARSAGQALPEARATSDIDLFLMIKLFTKPEIGRQVRSTLVALDYEERTPKWQFEKPYFPTRPDPSVVVDLLARPPEAGSGVRVRADRVGAASGADIHGRRTPEAFAVEDATQWLDIVEDGSPVARVSVAHPYAFLNMKVRAAYDWLRYRSDPWPLRERQQPPSPKHAFDAALVVAMLGEAELAEARDLATKWRAHDVATGIRGEAVELFDSASASGWLEARRQGMFDDHALIWGAMQEALGIA